MLQSMSLLPQLLIQFIYCWAHSSLNSFISTHLWKIYQTYGHDFGCVKSVAWRIPVKIISNLIIFIFTVMIHNLLKDIELLHWTFGIFPEARILFFQWPSSICSSCPWWRLTRRFDGGQIFKLDNSAFTTQQGPSQGSWRKSNYLVNIINSLN